MGFAIDRSRTIISAMILGRRVSAQDVAWLRREVFAGREVTREAADELFAVARADMDNAPEWTEFFVEMIAEYVVRQAEPTGVVSEERAAWLLARVDECKSVEALAALDQRAGGGARSARVVPSPAVKERASPRLAERCEGGCRAARTVRNSSCRGPTGRKPGGTALRPPVARANRIGQGGSKLARASRGCPRSRRVST